MLTTAEVALATDRSISTVTMWIRRGRLPATRIGRVGAYRIAADDFLRFVERERLALVNPFLCHVEP